MASRLSNMIASLLCSFSPFPECERLEDRHSLCLLLSRVCFHNCFLSPSLFSSTWHGLSPFYRNDPLKLCSSPVLALFPFFIGRSSTKCPLNRVCLMLIWWLDLMDGVDWREREWLYVMLSLSPSLSFTTWFPHSLSSLLMFSRSSLFIHDSSLHVSFLSSRCHWEWIVIGEFPRRWTH